MADRVPLDFDPPVRQLRALLLGITDADLGTPTPCPDWTLGDLLDHIIGFTYAYTQAARKLPDLGPPVPPSRANLPLHWRSRLPVQLEELAAAWRDPVAWTGTVTTRGATMSATQTGMAAMNELIMHSWDLARATGQQFAADPRTLEALIEMLSQSPATDEIDDEAVLLDLALELSGRNPRWRHRNRPAAPRDEVSPAA